MVRSAIGGIAVGGAYSGRPSPSGRRIYSVDTAGGRVSLFLYLSNVVEHAPSISDLCLYNPEVYVCFCFEHHIEIVPPSGRFRMVPVINGIQQEYGRFECGVQICSRFDLCGFQIGIHPADWESKSFRSVFVSIDFVVGFDIEHLPAE